MANAKIVVVDDDQDIRASLQAILESRQYSVITAASKEEGLEKIKAEKPDLAILDVMMSSWDDGFEIARKLKKDAQLKNIPILMLTGVKDKTGIDFKSTAGDLTWCPVDGFLEKPVDPDILLPEIAKLLSKSFKLSPRRRTMRWVSRIFARRGSLSDVSVRKRTCSVSAWGKPSAFRLSMVASRTATFRFET